MKFWIKIICIVGVIAGLSYDGLAHNHVSISVPQYKWTGVSGDGYNPFSDEELMDKVYFEINYFI